MTSEDEIQRLAAQRPAPREVQCKEYLGVGSMRHNYKDAGKLRQQVLLLRAENDRLRAEIARLKA